MREAETNPSPRIHPLLVCLGTQLAYMFLPPLQLDVAYGRQSNICHFWAWAFKKSGMTPMPSLSGYQYHEVLGQGRVPRLKGTRSLKEGVEEGCLTKS